MLTDEEVARTLSDLADRGVSGEPEFDRAIDRLNGKAVDRRVKPWTTYSNDPLGYIRDILQVKLTSDQENIVKAMDKPPYRVHVDSGHGTGKTLLAACLVNYRYDSYDPGVTICVSPNFSQLASVLFGYIRTLRERACKLFKGMPFDFAGSSFPKMQSSPDHYVIGTTADKIESLHGRHYERMFILFEEAEGLERMYYTAASSMFMPNGKHWWLSIDNPTTLQSAAYMESRKLDTDGNPIWKLFRLSCLEHPNVKAELAGLPPPIPGAVTASQIDNFIHDYYCDIINQSEATPTDFEWRGKWYRPGPEAEPRILGLRPSRGSMGVWSDGLWDACERLELPFPLDEPPELGCDVARVLGGDNCDIHVRWGGNSMFHDSANGRPIPGTAGKLKEMADKICEVANEYRKEAMGNKFKEWFPTDLPIKIDDSGVGGAVVDMRGDYNFIPVNSSKANQDLKYPNLRSELWFEVMERARLGLLSVRELTPEWRDKLRLQALSPLWTQDAGKRRVVEKKDVTKKRLGSSPDAMDAFNLAFLNYSSGVAKPVGPPMATKLTQTMGAKLGLLGRGQSSEDRKHIGRLEKMKSGFRTLGR